MPCIFTEEAEKDLEIIADYITLDNPARAISFVHEIRERCHRIADAPQGYPLAPEHGENVRKVPFGNWGKPNN
jgi:toxin ParE1/3/4